MIVNQWVPAAHRGDAIGDSARRVRDLLRGAGPRVRALRADDRRRPAGDVRPFDDPAATRGDLTIFHYALPSPMTAAFASLGARPRPAVPQRDAGAVFRAVRPGAVPPGVARAGTSWRRWPAASTWRSATPNTTGRSSKRSASRRPASSRSPSTRRASRAAGRSAGARHDPRRRPRELPVRRPDRARTRRSRITSGWPSTTSATSTRTTASSSSGGTTWCRGIIR